MSELTKETGLLLHHVLKWNLCITFQLHMGLGPLWLPPQLLPGCCHIDVQVEYRVALGHFPLCLKQILHVVSFILIMGTDTLRAGVVCNFILTFSDGKMQDQLSVQYSLCSL